MTKITRNQKRKFKRKKLLLTLVITPFILLSAIFIYGYLQYKSAFESSMQDSIIDRKTEEEFTQPKVINDKYNALLLGIDARGEESSRTDTIMIAQYDGKTKDTKIVSIMRDSYVEIPGYGYNKINAAHAFGSVELLRKTIKHNFDIDIHYYAIVDFQSFPRVVDVAFPEGIDINVEKEMSKGINTKFTPGLSRLTGDQLLDYVRFRQDEESDFGRVRRQQEVIKVLSSEFSNFNSLIKLPKIVGTALPYIQTNMDNSLLFSIGSSVLFDNNADIESLRIPVDQSFTNARYDHAGLVLELDIEENRNAISEFLN